MSTSTLPITAAGSTGWLSATYGLPVVLIAVIVLVVVAVVFFIRRRR